MSNIHDENTFPNINSLRTRGRSKIDMWMNLLIATSNGDAILSAEQDLSCLL